MIQMILYKVTFEIISKSFVFDLNIFHRLILLIQTDLIECVVFFMLVYSIVVWKLRVDFTLKRDQFFGERPHLRLGSQDIIVLQNYLFMQHRI